MHTRGKTIFGKTLRLHQSIMLDQPDQQYISHLVQDQPYAICILMPRIRSAQRSAQLSGFNRPCSDSFFCGISVIHRNFFTSLLPVIVLECRTINSVTNSRLYGIILRQGKFGLPNVFLKFEFQDDRSINVGAVGGGGRNLSFPINKAHRLYNSLYRTTHDIALSANFIAASRKRCDMHACK